MIRRGAGLAVLVLGLLLAGAACSGDGSETAPGGEGPGGSEPVVTPPPEVALGTKHELPDKTTVVVYEYRAPLSPQGVQVPQGKQYSGVDLEMCAGDVGHQPAFQVIAVLADGDRVPAGVSVMEPAFDTRSLLPDECERGWETFSVPVTAEVVAIEWRGFITRTEQVSVRWTVE